MEILCALEPISFLMMLSISMFAGVIFGILVAKLILWAIN
jgi:hypothetical protein